MKKFSLSKKLLLVSGVISLAVACQSKPVRPPSQHAQPMKSEIQEQGEEEESDEESSWDHTESFKTEERQLKSAAVPTLAEPAKASELPKTTVAVPAEQAPAPIVEKKEDPASAAPVVEVKTPAQPATSVVEVKAPVVESKAAEAPAATAEKQKVEPASETAATSAPAATELKIIAENVEPAVTAP